MKLWMLSIGLAAILLLGGCSGNVSNTSKTQVSEQGKNNPENTQKDTNQNSNTAFSQTPVNSKTNELMFSDMKVGDLTLGQTLESVQSKFGDPELKTIAHGNGDPQWEYNKQGFVVIGSRIWKIRVFSGFAGSTPRGIHIGSTEQDVKNAYPFLKLVQKGTQLFGETSDKKYSIDFMLSQGIVTQIIMSDENP
ncbi:hypothetical protein [Desulfosporosinus sp. SB140]|uniref:hypothetical protein n=1 Tax=Desulfosporosinus paludis TaxID=3115649 RepID=UPI00388F8A50